MGVKGLSKNVIKVAWRDGRLADLPAGFRVGVDAAGWLHKAVAANAKAICEETPTRDKCDNLRVRTERRAAANERLQHSGAIQPPLSTQRAASCAQRWPTYHPVHVRFMFCASCADVMDKRYRGGATKLMCWRPLNVM